ncbi:MAG TPA: hypothetical protein VIR33_14875, partial [Thermopolyspora sp.]
EATSRSEQLISHSTMRSESMLSSAQHRASSLDEHTGRRVAYLTDAHGEVMRRLNEIGTVLTDLLQKEKAAGPLIDEASVLPPAPVIVQEGDGPVPEPTRSPEAADPEGSREPVDDLPVRPEPMDDRPAPEPIDVHEPAHQQMGPMGGPFR